MTAYDSYMEKRAAVKWQKMLPRLSDAAVEHVYDSLSGLFPQIQTVDFLGKPRPPGQRAGMIRSAMAPNPSMRPPQTEGFLATIREHVQYTGQPQFLPTAERAKRYKRVSDGIWGTAGSFPGMPSESAHGPLLVAPRVMDKPIQLHHGTSASHMAAISQEGLTSPVGRERANTIVRSELVNGNIHLYTNDLPGSTNRISERVFMTPLRERAEHYARMTGGGDGIVVSKRLTGRGLRELGAISYDGGTHEPEIALRHVPPSFSFRRPSP